MSNRFTSRLSDDDDFKRDELIRKIEHSVEPCPTICLPRVIWRIIRKCREQLMREPEIANWQNINSQLAKRKQPTSA